MVVDQADPVALRPSSSSPLLFPHFFLLVSLFLFHSLPSTKWVLNPSFEPFIMGFNHLVTYLISGGYQSGFLFAIGTEALVPQILDSL